MEHETKKRNKTKSHNIVSLSEKTFSQKEPEKFGLLKRFLDWIARGADESGADF